MKRYIKAIKWGGMSVAMAGLFLLAPLVYYQFRDIAAVSGQPIKVQRQVMPASNEPLISGNPIAVTIPSLGLQLPVINGTYNARTGDWTLTSTKAQFATPSSQPNNLAGNTLIYGHALPQVFGPLTNIAPGAQAVVTTDNGYIFRYRFVSTEVFNPSDTSIFSYTGAPRLTLQTCSGTFSQHRQMYYFAYDGYQKAS